MGRVLRPAAKAMTKCVTVFYRETFGELGEMAAILAARHGRN
jgi:hypothetical protein